MNWSFVWLVELFMTQSSQCLTGRVTQSLLQEGIKPHTLEIGYVYSFCLLISFKFLNIFVWFKLLVNCFSLKEYSWCVQLQSAIRRPPGTNTNSIATRISQSDLFLGDKYNLKAKLYVVYCMNVCMESVVWAYTWLYGQPNSSSNIWSS